MSLPPGPNKRGTPGFQHIGAQAGTYVLILRNTLNRQITAGRLGKLRLEIGAYAYVGSAFGPGGIAARCRHHAHKSSKPHWHIDYLRATTELLEIWFSHDPQRREHQWSELLKSARGSRQPFPGFGASDCDCLTHLFYFPRQPSFESFRRRSYQSLPDQAPIRREVLASLDPRVIK